MDKVTLRNTKVAWIRGNYPPGMSVPGQLNCRCGNGPIINFKPQPNVTCQCGTVYTWDGWIVKSS